MFPRHGGAIPLLVVCMSRVAQILGIHIGLRHRYGVLAALLLLSPLSVQAVFTTPGSFEVNPDGSVGYSIPIQVPPGTAGMSPKLSLNYNSKGGNGILGMGWSLDGLTQITRCPQTLVQDGKIESINFDSISGNDRFCIDGQRLIAVGGTYGANGTEYRTELANFAKIISYGVAGDGPAWFKVWTKSGQIIEYGNTDDSRMEAQGKSSVFTWAANKISDTKGNYLSVNYTEDNANGETVINQIDYTGNASAGLSTYAYVRFIYEARPDVVPAYVAGSMIKITKRMSKIQTYVRGALVMEYRLAYAQSPSTQRSRMSTVTQCAADGTCQLPIRFTWSERNNVFVDQGAVANGYSNWTTSTNRIRPMDVNGDGREDIVIGPDSSGKWFVLRSNGTGLVDDGAWISGAYGNWSDKADRIRPMDVNGDGLQDIVIGPEGTGNWYVLRSTGTGFVDDGAWISGVYSNWTTSSSRIRPMDVNGDGREDIVIGPNSSGEWFVLRSTGSGFVDDGAWIGGAYGNFSGAASRIWPMDVNGDGLQDIVIGPLNSTGEWYVLRSTGVGFVDDGAWISGAYGSWSDKATRIRPMDVNGDGLQDIVIGPEGTGNWYVLRSTGTGFVDDGAWISGVYSNWTTSPNRIRPMDVNGDGLQDIVIGPDAYGKWFVLRSTGSGLVDDGAWISGVYGNFNGSASRIRPMDVNGDGLQDIVIGPEGTGNWYVLGGDPATDRLTRIYGDLGQEVTITYKPLTDGSVYMKDNGSSASAYPVQDVQEPMYVVSSVSSSDGLGGSIVTDYNYGGAKVDLTGRGFLGFRWTKTTSLDAGINLTSFYNQAYPFVGLIAQTEKRTNTGTLLTVASNTYANTEIVAGSARSKFPYVSQTLENNYELDSSLVTSAASTYQYDTWGNATQVAVVSNDGHVKTTTSTYANDATNWHLGRLLRSSVTSTAPDPVAPSTPLSVTINPIQLTVNASSSGTVSGSASVTIAGGIAPYTYTWSRMSGSRINVSGGQNGSFSASMGWSESLTETFRATVVDAAGNVGTTDLNVTFTVPPPFTFTATIAANTTNYNLKNAAIAAGWNQIVPLVATVTVNSGVIIGSTSTSSYAFDTGASFPAGTTLALVNNGKILGAGGNGGKGSTTTSLIQNNTAGSPGGTAMQVQFAMAITNNGTIGGGGGGAAGKIASSGGKGGGGGQGSNGGAGGAKGISSNFLITATAGTAGTATSPGSPGGGTLGVEGAASNLSGGAGGACASGNANITWVVAGTRYGALN